MNSNDFHYLQDFTHEFFFDYYVLRFNNYLNFKNRSITKDEIEKYFNFLKLRFKGDVYGNKWGRNRR